MSENTNSTPTPYDPDDGQITFFGQANFRSAEHRFGIKRDDRRRHMYVIGKTGMGKSTMLENMIIQDIQNGEGVAVVDPHGDLVEKVVDYVPASRINDVVYINPADLDFPIAFNILENVDPEYRNLVSNGLVGVFKKIWADSWGPRLEYILINTILALLEYPGSTLLGVMRMLVDARYRKKVVRKITDPVVRSFWINEFNNYSEKFRNEAIAPIQNKIGQFLSSSLIRNMVGQVKSAVNMRELMDEGKIVLMNLSKGRIGEENSALLGAMIITKIQLAAMSRVDIPEHTRRDFYLYVDEFQNFSTDSFAGILSEARKYHLNIIMAHQYIEQLTDEVRAAVFGNVGTMAAFRVGATDAEELEKEFMPTFTQEDIVTLPAYQIYLRLMIDGVASEPFSANTLPPISEPTGNAQKVIEQSRQRYSSDRLTVEEEILRWSGDEDNMPPAVKKMDEEKAKEKEQKPAEQPKQQQTTVAQVPVPQPPKPPTPPAPEQSKEDELAELRAKALSFVEDLADENNAKADKEKMDRIREANKRKRDNEKGDQRGGKRNNDRNRSGQHSSGGSSDGRQKKRDHDGRKKQDGGKKEDNRKQESRKDDKQNSGDDHSQRQEKGQEKPEEKGQGNSRPRNDQGKSQDDGEQKKRKRRRKRKRSRNSDGGGNGGQQSTRDESKKSSDAQPRESKPQQEKKELPFGQNTPPKKNASSGKPMQPGQSVRFDE